MTFHAELSPSARHRWGACPGSRREEAKHPEPPSNPTAIDGTRTHALLEYCIKAGCIGPQHLVGTVREDEYGSYTVDQARADRIQVAIDYIRSRPGFEKAIAESRVYPDGLIGRADMSGTVDCQIPGKDVYEIIDYKDGMAPVTAEGNPQLIQYAIGALAGLEKHPKSFQLTIIQPKLATKGMPVISTWNVGTKALLDALPYIKAQADATDDPDAPLVPGEAQCKYCRAKGSCKALADDALKKVSVMFQNNPITPTVEGPDLDVAHQAAQKDPTKMSDHELRQIMDAAPLLEQLIKGVKDEVKSRLERGVKVPGYKLVKGNGSRKWKLDDSEMEKKLTTTLKIPKAVLYPRKLISPAGIKTVTWEKDGATHKLSAGQIAKVETEWVTYTPGGPVVVPEGDPREAIAVDVSEMFNTIPVEATPVVPPPPFLNVATPAFLNVTVPSFLKV